MRVLAFADRRGVTCSIVVLPPHLSALQWEDGNGLRMMAPSTRCRISTRERSM